MTRLLDVMRPDGRSGRGPSHRPVEGSPGPAREGGRIPLGRDGSSGTLGWPMAFPTLPARVSARPELLGDLAVAVVALVLSLGLLAASARDLQEGGRAAGVAGVLLTALASLP